MFRVMLALVWVAIGLWATLPGLEYYETSLQERPFVPGHDAFASSAPVGHGYGVLGASMMLAGVAGYAARKRIAAIRNMGRLRRWLQVHIFLCTLGPYLVLLHTTFRFGGLVAISFWSMVLVVASGIFGRYVYVRIPKTVQGHFLTLEDMEARREGACERIREHSGLEKDKVDELLRNERPASATGSFRALWMAFGWDLRRRRARHRSASLLNRIGAPPEVRQELETLLREEERLERQIALLHPFQRLFRYWHIFHLPLAILMFLILGVHVAVAVVFGYAWVF